MKRSIAALMAASLCLVAGCAAVDSVISKTNLTQGTRISEEKLATFKKGTTRREDVIAAIGQPSTKAEVMGKEVWTYSFTKIPSLPFQKVIFEHTAIEFDRSGILIDAYRTSAGSGGGSLQ